MMKYVFPTSILDSEVAARLGSAASDEEIMDVVLSAIYHCGTQFAGDALVEAFQRISGPNRLYLGSMVCTFLQIHRTTYKVDDFINEMKKAGPDPGAMAGNIQEAVELKELFA